MSERRNEMATLVASEPYKVIVKKHPTLGMQVVGIKDSKGNKLILEEFTPS